MRRILNAQFSPKSNYQFPLYPFPYFSFFYYSFSSAEPPKWHNNPWKGWWSSHSFLWLFGSFRLSNYRVSPSVLRIFFFFSLHACVSISVLTSVLYSGPALSVIRLCCLGFTSLRARIGEFVSPQSCMVVCRSHLVSFGLWRATCCNAICWVHSLLQCPKAVISEIQ